MCKPCKPWVIPYLGCASKDTRGGYCHGDPTNTINKKKYCYTCVCFMDIRAKMYNRLENER